jgi:lysyl-tRNA synthetase class 2
MADLVESMICHVAQEVFGTLLIEHRDASGNVTRRIDLKRPWRRARIVDLVRERVGWNFDRRPLQEACPAVLEKLATAARVVGYPPAQQLVEVYEKLIEPTLIDPCFVTHLPSSAIPLARENGQDPFFADVYELAINGVEISPGYSELNDPDVQARHFAHQIGDEAEKQKTDDDFLTALKYGMPPAGGMGMGVDRLIMMLSGAESIRDVILFPLMRPSSAAPDRVGNAGSPEKS